MAPMQPSAIAVPVPAVSSTAASGGAATESGSVGSATCVGVGWPWLFNRVGGVSRSDNQVSCSAFGSCVHVAKFVHAKYTGPVGET